MLTKKKLIEKIKEIEWEDFEVKKAKNAVPKDSWESVSAFANTRGGYIVFGVEKTDVKFIISGVNNPEKIHSDFITTLRSEKFNTAFSAISGKKTIDGKTVLVYYIPGMPRQAKPIYFNNIRNTFIRSGGTDQRATKKEIERFLREASESSSDSMVLKDATIDDLRKDTIERFVTLFRSVTQDDSLASLNPEELLIRKGFLRKSRNGNIKITAAAILQFGTDMIITKYFPHYKVDYFEVPGTRWGGIGEKRWDYRILSESNLFETYQMIMPRLKIRVPNPFALKKDGITREGSSPALTAIREAFINLLVHTDYFDRKGASIKVYEDRIEMMNGGSLLFDEALLKDGDISEPRNPIIIRAYRMVNLAENAGSGFFKINTNWKEAGFKLPKLESNRRENYFKLIFGFNSAKRHSPGRDQVGTKQIFERHPASTPQVPRKYHASTTQAPRKYRVGTKLGLSWDQVGTKLGLSRDQVIKVLELCKESVFVSELMDTFSWQNRTKFRDRFLNPLLEDELLMMTLSGKPTSPNQKYIITEKGKQFLEQIKNK